MPNANRFTRPAKTVLRKKELKADLASVDNFIHQIKSSINQGIVHTNEALDAIKARGETPDPRVLRLLHTKMEIAVNDVTLCEREVVGIKTGVDALPMRIKPTDVNATILFAHTERLEAFGRSFVKVTIDNLIGVDTAINLLRTQAYPKVEQETTTQPEQQTN